MKTKSIKNMNIIMNTFNIPEDKLIKEIKNTLKSPNIDLINKFLSQNINLLLQWVDMNPSFNQWTISTVSNNK